MPPTERMRHLTTVQGPFHGRVVAARLGAEGIFAELRGIFEGPYPLNGVVEVYVTEDQLELGREILLADAVDAAVDDRLIELDYHDGAAAGELAGDPGGRRHGVVFHDLDELGDFHDRDDLDLEDPEGGVDGVWTRRAGRLGSAVALALVVALVVVGIVAISG